MNFQPIRVRLTLKGRNIPFVNHVNYLGVIFDRRIRWRMLIECIGLKDSQRLFMLTTFSKLGALSADTALTLHKALARSIMTYDCPVWEFAVDTSSFQIAVRAKQVSPHHW
jgi:hypothetical protein